MDSFSFHTTRLVLAEIGATGKIGGFLADRGCRKVETFAHVRTTPGQYLAHHLRPVQRRQTGILLGVHSCLHPGKV